VNKEFLETIRCEDGEVFHLPYHQLRYESVLNSLGAKDFKELSEYIDPPKKGLYRCRVLYTTQDISVEYIPYTQRKIKKLKLVESDTIEYSKKYADRSQLDTLFSQRENADDILIIKNKKVTDTSIANIALYDGVKWFTPKEPLLKGTTRARLLDEGKIFERDILENELENFQKLALLNAMIDFDIITQENIRNIYC